MSDLTKTIAPKTDQLNADDLIGVSSKTIKITKVSILGEDAQPIAVSFEGDNGKPYKPCKSMRRVLVQIWGGDGNQYIGRSLTLYRDDKVMFAGIAVGGIRISHMSHIEKDITMALTASKASRKPYTVKPLTQTTAASPSSPTLKDELSAFSKEIDLADTPEKLEGLEQRYVSLGEKLSAASLPKWKDQLRDMMENQKNKLDPGRLIWAG